MSKLPNRVPLPEVSEHTEDIIFGNLGLPQGFDDERLLVNLRAIDRVRSLARLGIVTVTAFDGEHVQQDVGVSGFDSSGTAAMSTAGKRQKKPGFANGSITFPTDSSNYDEPSVAIVINTSAREDAVQQNQHYRRGMLDPKAQARTLDSALRQGMMAATKDANTDKFKLKASLRYYGLLSLAFELFDDGHAPLDRLIPIVVGAGPAMMNLAALREAVLNDLNNGGEGESVPERWKRFRQSIFVGCALDRVVAADTVARSVRFMRAEK